MINFYLQSYIEYQVLRFIGGRGWIYEKSCSDGFRSKIDLRVAPYKDLQELPYKFLKSTSFPGHFNSVFHNQPMSKNQKNSGLRVSLKSTVFGNTFE